MNETNADSKTWSEIHRLADELELKIHLARMEARDRWAALKPQLAKFERDVEATTTQAAQILIKSLRMLRDEVVQEIRERE